MSAKSGRNALSTSCPIILSVDGGYCISEGDRGEIIVAAFKGPSSIHHMRGRPSGLEQTSEKQRLVSFQTLYKRILTSYNSYQITTFLEGHCLRLY